MVYTGKQISFINGIESEIGMTDLQGYCVLWMHVWCLMIGGFHSHGDIQNGWFLSWKIPI